MSACEVAIERKQYADALVLQDVHLTITPGSFTALVGPSGAGKSTLLNIISGLDRDFCGRLAWSGGRPCSIGYVFQEPRLMPWLSVQRNIELVLPGGHDEDGVVAPLLARVGLADRAHAFPGELSGGMQRRVALARAMAIEPDLLLLDEPFCSLDEPTADSLRRLLLELWREQGNAVLLVTHNLREALALADQVLFLSRDPARIVLREQIGDGGDDPDGRDPDALLRRLLARHPGILSGIANVDRAG